MKIVRSTAEKCERVRHILQTHMVRYDERDMFMSRENQRELMERFGVDVVDVPQVFADGKHLGVSGDGLQNKRKLTVSRSRVRFLLCPTVAHSRLWHETSRNPSSSFSKRAVSLPAYSKTV